MTAPTPEQLRAWAKDADWGATTGRRLSPEQHVVRYRRLAGAFFAAADELDRLRARVAELEQAAELRSEDERFRLD